VVTHEDEIAEHARRTIRLRDGLIESDVKVAKPVLQDEQVLDKPA
jgi:putative ABC transport system ATP-binding protein